MTTSRMVIVLRTELGHQLSLAQKELQKVIDEKWKTNIYSEWDTKQTKEFSKWQQRLDRLQSAVHALGALQLGDIEDTEL